MTAKPHLRLTKRQILALRGIRLPAVALKAMRDAGIYCDPSVSIEYQTLAKKYVLRGRESGGAAGGTGAYCGFVNVDGGLLPWLSRVDSVGRNGVHAVVVAPAFVRIQMFRNEQTCELLITRHDLKFHADRKRPTLENEVLFHGFKGTLSGETVPTFRTPGGESLPIPDLFYNAVRRTATGALCSGCHHCHVTTSEPAHTTSSSMETCE